MANDSENQKGKGIILHLLILLGASIVVFLFYEYALSFFSATKYPNLNPTLVFFHPVVQALCLTAFLSGTVTLFFLPMFKFAWDNYLSKQVNRFFISTDEHLKEIGSQASTVSDKIKDLSDEFEKYIRAHAGPLPLDQCKTTEEFSSFLDRTSSRLYGPHCENPQSLYSHVKKTLLDPFCCAPHRSMVRKAILVSEHENPEYVYWHERTDFNIHHVLNCSKPVEGHYTLEFEATSFAPDMDPEGWSNAASLLVMVDKQRILTKQDNPTFEENRDEEGFFCWKKGDWIVLRYKKILELIKEFTSVWVAEDSINSKADKTYTMNTSQPTFGHFLDFTLPKEYAFIRQPFISPELVVMGLPAFILNEVNNQNLVKVQHDDDNHIRIDLAEWILPGIIMNLNWIERDEK